jgi:bacteriorhodopsin
MKELLKSSIEGSLFVQVVTLLFNFYGFTVPILPSDVALKEILGLETIVQMIELVFYGWYRGVITRMGDVARFRYYDWFLTTPMMLFSTAAFYGYLKRKEEQATDEQKEDFRVWTFLQENLKWILVILFFNVGMLFFGYMNEIGRLSIVWSTLFGFASFAGTFWFLYDKFASKVPNQQGIYQFMVSIWSLYGVAALFESGPKNISYNILDLIAKNFYGLYLTFYIEQRKI